MEKQATITQSKIRLEEGRIKRKSRLANETEEERQRRLQKRRDYLSRETDAQRQKRLAILRRNAARARERQRNSRLENRQIDISQVPEAPEQSNALIENAMHYVTEYDYQKQDTFRDQICENEEGSFDDQECGNPLLEPAVELSTDDNEEQADSYYPFDSLSVEINEGLEGDAAEEQEDSNEAQDDDQHEANSEVVTQSYDSFNDEIYNANGVADSTMSDSTENSLDASSFLEEDQSVYSPQDYQETNLQQFIYSGTSKNKDEGSCSSAEESKEEKKYPLSRFPKVVKALESADYETVQILYQLLFQRSAWDTEELLKQRILEFTGFNFDKNSEDYFNRDMMLKTQPDEVLLKLGGILGLDHIQKMVSGGDKARCDIIAAIMQFLTIMRNLSRTRRRVKTEGTDMTSQDMSVVTQCGCKSRCLFKVSKYKRKALLEYLKELNEKKLLDKYLFNLLEVTKHSKKEDAKRLREVAYQYRVKLGAREFTVCKGAFAVYHGLKRNKVVQLQTRLKFGNVPQKMEMSEFPVFVVPETSPQKCSSRKSSAENELISAETSSNKQSSSKTERLPIKEEIKTSPITQKVPKIIVEKLDPNALGGEKYKIVTPPEQKRKSWEKEDMIKALQGVKSKEWGVGGACKTFNIPRSTLKRYLAEIGDAPIEDYVNFKVGLRPFTPSAKFSPKSESSTSSTPEKVSEDKTSEKNPKTKSGSEKKMLKEFPLVVTALGEASKELLVDMHFLLFLNSDDEDKVKENILNFSGFSFDCDSEEYDERNEFLQRMSSKIVSDVAKSFSIEILGNKEDTIKNILAFLQKPSENFIKIGESIPLTLSDVELDDIDGFSDSDESITCEVVEKKVECIDLLSSGEDSDDDKPKKVKSPKKPLSIPNPISVAVVPKPAVVSAPIIPQPPVQTAPQPESNSQAAQPSQSGVERKLRDFETICKIVNTHPHEYLIDIFDLLYMKKHEPNTLRNDILDFSGFTFDRGSTEYIKRKQFLDRMLYNSVRRIYNTLIHNTTEVKVFSKPTMITEIFQFLFKLPDHDTSIRPAQVNRPVAKSPFPTTVKSPPVGAVPAPGVPNLTQSTKLSDLKRVFQRVACFPCEYLIDVHKLLFMTDCDPKVIRQNIFAFKGFSFGPDSPDFQQRKMYLEYLTFHSLRKISSVLTTRSVDLRNSTKHELASHLTQVLAEYCNTHCEPEIPEVHINTPNTSSQSSETVSVSSSSDTAVENIVVTPIIDPIYANPPIETTTTPTPTPAATTPKPQQAPVEIAPKPQQTTETSPITSLAISIVNARSVTTTPRTRKRKQAQTKTISQIMGEKKTPPQKKTNVVAPISDANQFADINLPEVETYRQMYGQIYNPNIPTITGITTFNTGIPQAFPIAPAVSTVPFPLVQVQPSPMIVQVQSKPSEVIVPGECLSNEEDTPSKKQKVSNSKSSEETFHNKIRDAMNGDEDEDCDKPLSSLIGHPIDSALKKNIADIVQQTDLQDITINGVIQKVFAMYPKFDLSYRKEFIKSTVRSLLYKLGEAKNPDSSIKIRDTSSPDCSVTTSDLQDSSMDVENSSEATAS